MSDFTIQTIIGTSENAVPNRSEALRYMGYKNSAVLDDATTELIDECEKELLSVIKPVCCYAYHDVKFLGGGAVDIGFGAIQSENLTAHLKGCSGVYLFAATVGIAADRLIAKYNRIKPAKGVITDALSSSAIESWCDFAELKITEKDGDHCSRFSAGYGDFPLKHQTDFMNCLEMNRKLGITLSDSLLMTPTKSVTAVIGLGAANRTCGAKCMSCTNKTCIYRSEG